MATITLPHVFVDGSIASSDEVMENFYNPDLPGQSFETLNGYLDNSNRASGWGELDFRHIRQGAFSSGEMVGKTEPIDFMGGGSGAASVFNPGTNSDGEAYPGAYEPISGASIEFYLPDDPTAVIFTWQIFVGTDASFTAAAASTAKAFLYLLIDGVAQTETKRELPFMFCDDTLSGGAGTFNDRRQRVYSGHCVKTNLTAGWHSASLRIWSSANLARVRVRNMKYIRLK
jgi:hypothetical protein